MNRPATALRAAVRFAKGELPARATRVPGPTLALYRVASGVAQSDVAESLDTSKQYIHKLERDGATIAVAGRFRAAVDQLAAEAA